MQNDRKLFRFRLFALLVGILCAAHVFAQQQITVQGVVKDETGEGIPGASVIQEGTSNGVTTDLDGKFTLTVPERCEIQISYLGYMTQLIPIKGQTSLNVILEENTEMLSEVVVIGYGSVDKKELTSAVSHVSSKDFLNISASDPAMQIQGKVAGVSIENRGSGDPNSSSNIQVRGLSSRSAGTGPLIVIDGVPGGNLQNVNSNDIASIDVLKDGAASAIYGTRGSNGVILVTTKQGSKDGSVHTTYNGYVSADFIVNPMKTLTAEQFRQWRVPQGGVDYGGNTDWMDEVSQTGLAQLIRMP